MRDEQKQTPQEVCGEANKRRDFENHPLGLSFLSLRTDI